MRYCLKLFVVFLIGCSTAHYISNEDLSYLYTFNHQEKPKAKVFYENQDNPRLIAQIPKNLLTKQNNSEKSGSYAVQLKYLIYKNYEFHQILDSQAVTLKDEQLTNQNYLHHEFKLPPVDKRYLVALEIQDLVAQEKVKAFTYYHPYESAGAQQFSAKHPKGNPFFKPYCTPDDTLSLQHTENTRTLVANHFSANQAEVAPPPFIAGYRNRALEKFRKDSSFTLDTQSPFTLNKEGLYSFGKAVESENNFNVLLTNRHFPQVKKVRQLVKGLIYLTPSDAFNKMYNSDEPKAAVDSFWLNCADGDKKLAKRLIKYYYNGMEQANTHFTTYKKGWKTDRGMVYMIFGEPYMVYRDNDRETWVYPENENFPELNFQFIRRSSRLCGEFYELQRSEYYKNVWHQAVEKWRNGKIRAQMKH